MERDFERPRSGSERETLQSFMEFLRAALIAKVEGLDPERAGKHLVASQTTLLGIVKHCTDCQEHWFRVMMMSDDIALTYYREDDEYADWRIEPSDTVESVVAAYRAACERADQAIKQYSLDDIAQRGDQNLRWIYLEMIYDTARHCGHADILRELTDGLTGE